MSGVILRSEAAAAPVAAASATTHRCQIFGQARIAYRGDGAASRLAGLYQTDPLRVLFPGVAAGDIPCAALVTTAGGLVGGDRLGIAASVGPGAAAQVAGQAAEKVYRSTGADVSIDVELDAAAGGWLEWLPQETILFDGARLRRMTTVAVEGDARVLAGEIVVFGRTAMGETVRSGLLNDRWRIRRDGRAVWADALHIDGAFEVILAAPAGFDGARAAATAVYAGPDPKERLDAVREWVAAIDAPVRAGVTVVNGILVVRFLAADALALRTAFGGFWAWFRNRAGGWPAVLPRLWSV